GETYSYDLNVLVDGGEISCDPAISITPQPLPKVGVSRTWYFNEQTEIDLILPENASEEFVYVVKENSAIIESKIDEQTVTVNAPDLKDHTYTVHVGVVMNDGNIMTGEGTTVTIDRGELWKLKNITDDADGVHLYWDVLADSMPTKLFVMSYDVTDADKHVNRGGAEADAESGTYVDAEAAFTGKKLGYWLEAEYRDGVNGGLLSSEGMSDCEELLPYQVRKLEKVAGLKTSYAGKMVDLIWNAQEEVPAYEIERSDDNGASYTAVATVSAEEYEANMETTEGRSAYTDTVPNFDAKYLYRVRAVAGEQAGAYSDAAVAVIGVVPKVTSAVYSHKQGGVALTWEKYTAPSDYTLDSYVILRQAEGDSEHKPYREVGAGVTTFVDGDVEVGKTYSYKVAVGMKMNPADDMITAQITSENACEVTPEALKNPGAVIPLYENTADKAKFERVDEAEYYEMYAVKDGVIGDEPVDTVKQDELRLSSSGAYVGTFRYELGDNFAEENTYVIYAVVGAVSGKKIMSSGVETTIPKRGEKPNVTGVALIEEGVEVSFDQITDANLDSITVEREDVAMLDATNGEEGREFFNGIDKQSSVYLDTTAVAGKKYVYNVVAHYGQGSIMSDSSEEYTVPTTLYTYTVENGVATVTGYLGKDVSDMEIPDTVDDKYPVRVIGNGEPFATPNAEGGLTGTLTLPEGLEEIGNCAFDGAGITGELVLPETLKTIGERAFASTGISGELVIPENVETIGAGAFNVCAGLTSVTIQGADTELGVGMLRNDWNLTTITLPEGMTTIPELFAQGNKKLTSVNIPSTVTTIGMSAFSGCTALTGTIKIPAGVTTLGAGAFGDTGYTAAEIYNKTLTEAAIADAFGKKFAGDELVACTVNLTKVCGYLGSGAYDYATNNGIEFVGIGLSDNGENFVWAEDGENAVFAGFETKPTGAVTIPATITVGDKEINVTEIGANAFSGNTAITSVTVLDGVTVIGESAFEGCTSLNSANLPDTVEIIGVRAFANCTSLSSMQ
ncbi:MAG: leucine-rich repeat protein, partial [Clostridia bacterium]|nr:leucine-rich repeat protein [Clostridia bacterium]